MTMSAEAKRALSTTIRSLRTNLLADLHAATETAYRLAVRAQEAGLAEAAKAKRARLEDWLAEQRRAQADTKSQPVRTDADFRREAEEQAAYTLLNRLVILRLMEAPGPSGEPLRAPAVVTGGWESRAYKDFRQLAPALVRNDPTEGYAFLLQLIFEDLATELPGLYGPVGIADLIPIPPATLRQVIEALDQPALASCWTDDMTLGWVYQYWNDPAREALDAKLNGGGKLAPHEIASKTQMFTERYMVDWLLQNSLGPLWLAMCKKQGWTPEVEADGTLARLEERRVAWRAQREAGTVSLTELMPLYTDAERRWAYYVPQPLPDDAVTQAPASVRGLKILDPAVGSGHFLVIALYLLVALYREEARHRGEAGQPEWSDRAIVERILTYNLHGIDLDPRAVQIAAAALWIKARQIAPDAQLEQLNLVASNLHLAGLPDDDPALVELRRTVEQETGIPGKLTDTVVQALRGADHLGSLLKVNRVVEEALAQFEGELGKTQPSQGDLFAGFPQAERTRMGRAEAQATLLDRLETFLTRHTRGDDLGLRLRGEQLAAGVRFVRMVREGVYDLVVANPPYQGTAKMADATYIEKQYSLGKADLYAAFLLRGLELVRAGGVSAMLTMRNWMFIKQYADLRVRLLATYDLRALGDFAVGAFDEVPNDVLSVAVSVFHRASQRSEKSVAQQPTPPDDRSYDRIRTQRKRAATLCHIGQHEFDPAALKVVPEWPLVYWWDDNFVNRYAKSLKVGDHSPIFMGISTSDNVRFLRRPWEVHTGSVIRSKEAVGEHYYVHPKFRPLISGAKGVKWMASLDLLVNWERGGLELGCFGGSVLRNVEHQMQGGVAFTPIGNSFSGRIHRFFSMFDAVGRSAVGSDSALILAIMNSTLGKTVAGDLNPSITFTIGDVERLPLLPIRDTSAILCQIYNSFAVHESHSELSVEFKCPGPSPWRYTQDWAQAAVDRPDGVPLPEYAEEMNVEPPTNHLSFALGVALGRFGPKGEGILDPTKDDLDHTLPAGILFLDGTLDGEERRDSLGHPAAAPLYTAWATYGPAIANKRKSLCEWLTLDFFKDVHKNMYENRPIHWPLSSANKTFVAWVNIHRLTEHTLRVLLADHLAPVLKCIDGELTDLRAARDGANKQAARDAEKRYDKLLKAREELVDFIAAVEQCGDRGAPPTDAQCPPREQNARYVPDLDDGVMINAAALWPLLEPQWKDPKKWWKELATAKGRKDYDWSHLALRYWPTRVDQKAQTDPSLGVAHGCFWRYHPARAWAWELRLQDEIGPAFRITEPPYRPGGRDLADPGDSIHRVRWLHDHPAAALAAVEKEALRRLRRNKSRTPLTEMRILEAGLWSALPAEVWELELRVAEKQGVDFRLLAPDEAQARAAFEAAHPGMVRARADFVAALVPQAPLLADEDEGEIGDGDDVDEQDLDAEEEA